MLWRATFKIGSCLLLCFFLLLVLAPVSKSHRHIRVTACILVYISVAFIRSKFAQIVGSFLQYYILRRAEQASTHGRAARALHAQLVDVAFGPLASLSERDRPCELNTHIIPVSHFRSCEGFSGFVHVWVCLHSFCRLVYSL